MTFSTRISLLEEIKQTRSCERWNEFFSEYGDLLNSWLINQNVSVEDAADIQQETMIAVFESLPDFEHNGRIGAFRNWLRKILTNRIRRVWERKNRARSQSDLNNLADTLQDNSSRVSIAFEEEHDRYLIQQLLIHAEKKFSPIRVKMFREIVLQERSIEEIAHDYNMTVGAARVQQHRILSWLKSVGQGIVEF